MINQKPGRLPWWRKLLSAAAALMLVGVTTAALQVVTPVAAFADTPSGSITMYIPPAGSGYAGWRGSDDYLNLSTTPTSLASGWCQVTAFDWTRQGGGHFDSRIVRSCQGNTFHSTGPNYWEPAGSYVLTGKQKLGVCRGGQGIEKLYTCVNYSEPGFSVTSISMNSTTCARTWQRNANGTTTYYSGGSFTSCSS